MNACISVPSLMFLGPQASGEAAYFKSTDGHFNNWSFNLRRPNVHLLPFIVKHNGRV